MIKLKNILLESMGNALNESDNATYERRVDAAKTFATELSKKLDVNISFFGYGFNELEPNLFKGEFRILDSGNFDELKKAIEKEYVVDEQGSTADSEIEFDRDRRYYPTIKITGIKDSAEKPEFEIYIDSVDIGNTTITSPNDTTTYDDFRNDIQDQLDDEGDNFVKAKVEGRVKVDNTDYKFQFETDDPDTTADNIYWDSDSFEQETGLDEQDILDKLTA
jgi:hypothetical protein